MCKSFSFKDGDIVRFNVPGHPCSVTTGRYRFEKKFGKQILWIEIDEKNNLYFDSDDQLELLKEVENAQ